MSASWWSWPETSSRRFTERGSGRYTPRTDKRVWDESGEDDRKVRRESSNTGVITAAESRPLTDFSVFVTRTASSPPHPATRVPASAAYVPSSAAVTVQTSEATEVQTYFNPKKIPAQLRKYDRLILDFDGMKKAECEKLFSERSSLRKGHRIQSLAAVQNRCSWRWDEEHNEMNKVEWYEIINLLKILFVMSSIFYSIVTSCSSLESDCDQRPDLVPASQLEFFCVLCPQPSPPGGHVASWHHQGHHLTSRSIGIIKANPCHHRNVLVLCLKLLLWKYPINIIWIKTLGVKL